MSFLVKVAQCKDGLQAFDLLENALNKKVVKMDRGAYIVYTDGTILWKQAQPKKLQSGEWGAIVTVQRNSSKPEKGEFVTVTKRDGTTYEAEITKVVGSNSFGVTVETNHKEEPKKAKSISEMTDYEREVKAKEYDRVMNEGGDGYNPYRRGLETEEEFNAEKARKAALPTERTPFEWTAPSNFPKEVAGKKLTLKSLHTQKGNVVVQFNELPDGTYVTTEGRPDLKKLVSDYYRQEVYTAPTKKDYSDVDFFAN